MDEGQSYHMTPEEFRDWGHRVVDWVAAYWQRVESLPVRSQAQPGAVRSQLPPHPPGHGEGFGALLADLDRVIVPGLSHWQHPSFFAYFPSNVSGPSVLAELLASGLGVQGMSWITSPACTELETHVMDWLVEMLGLPEGFLSTSDGGGVIQDTASSAALCALLAARERASGLETDRLGCDRRLVAYASTQAHSSIEKGVRVAGLGQQNLRLVEVDERLAMRPEALAAAMAADRERGLVPCFVTATIGTTSSNAVDPLPAIGPLCRRHGAWLHVDAAMAGTAMLCPEHRHLQAGLEWADSYCFNPHKWMFTNFDCDCFWVADRRALVRALSILPEYLRNQATDSGQVIDYRDWQVPLGRRFRALKLWAVIRHNGVEGLRHHVRAHIALARELAGWIAADPDFELVVDPPLNLVCFRHRGGDAVNQAVMDRLNSSGEMYLSHTRLADRLVLRLCIGQTWTRRPQVEAAWRRIRAAARLLVDGGDRR
ncbi:MAG: aspartate aminotransferase family protein [Thermoanaerobaculaceae bacterium]|nr:aspartate aminotransferase family protein [Thermoanaerobaculaceae bacterium]MDI9622405.1 pyridoxal-dependent decarboxylase [Acidobacteriota bacterium]NLH11160.1 aspartate aminotransferase family protein [Holophagae bacterium]HPW54306.1 pyridoxal-dependent decarboxylase [Thermoanaerobaculaceae bacterium]